MRKLTVDDINYFFFGSIYECDDKKNSLAYLNESRRQFDFSFDNRNKQRLRQTKKVMTMPTTNDRHFNFIDQ